MKQEISPAEYRCPGENYSISRAVHLGRLASFYPACRDCPRRSDSAGIASRQVRRLGEIGSWARRRPLFHSEGVGSGAGDLSPRLARRIAVEFARRIAPTGSATVVVAGDGRLETAAIFAAIVEGLRWSGCQVVDIGPATAPCAARAIDRLSADAGLFVGNPTGNPQAIGLKFWVHGEPLSQGPMLDEIAAAVHAGPAEAMVDRPTRTFGPLGRFAAADIYLDDLRPAYHALRPLRFVLDCRLRIVNSYLDELLRNVACQVIQPEGDFAVQVVSARAHFGIQIDDDGENGRVVDEQGRSVSAERLLRLLAHEIDGPVAEGGRLRQETFRQMRQQGATLAADPAGRLWQGTGHAPIPDALRTLTQLLVLLSRDDLPLSEVLNGWESV